VRNPGDGAAQVGLQLGNHAAAGNLELHGGAISDLARQNGDNSRRIATGGEAAAGAAPRSTGRPSGAGTARRSGVVSGAAEPARIRVRHLVRRAALVIDAAEVVAEEVRGCNGGVSCRRGRGRGERRSVLVGTQGGAASD